AGDRRSLCRRLVPYRRPRGDASRRLRRGEGPGKGHHYLRRREYFVVGSRGGSVPASVGDGGGGRGPSRREMGRNAAGLRDIEAGGRRGDRGGDHRLVPAASGALQVPTVRHVRGFAEDLDGKDSEIRSAGEGAGKLG